MCSEVMGLLELTGQDFDLVLGVKNLRAEMC